MSEKITVVILNYNGLDDLKECIPSVLASNDSNFDVLVVDNGSSDDSIKFLKEMYSAVKILALPTNTGYAVGNNIGLTKAFIDNSSFVVLLNNDTRVNPEWLTCFRDAFSSNSTIGICGAKILNWQGNIIEFDGSVFNPTNASGGYSDRPVSEDTAKNVIRDVGYACGGAMMISHECFLAIGGFDESFLFYNEDVDLSLRAWIYGFRVVINPLSIVYHKRGSSVSRFYKQGFRDYYGLRNSLTTVIKNYEPATFKCIYRDLIRIYFLSGKWYLLKGALANLLYLPRTLRKRWPIQRNRKRTDHEIFCRARGELYDQEKDSSCQRK